MDNQGNWCEYADPGEKLQWPSIYQVTTTGIWFVSGKGSADEKALQLVTAVRSGFLQPGEPSEAEIRKYLGLATLPHSGVKIGLLLHLQTSESFAAHSGHLAPLVVSVVLMSVLVNELPGPVLAKLAIQRAVKEEGRR